MSRKPPLPDDAVSPFPLTDAAADEREAVRRGLADKTAAAATTQPRWGRRVAVGSAIGSAAVAAALIYWNRSKTE